MTVAAGDRARLARVMRALRLPAKLSAREPVLLTSHSNDVWRIGSVVLRICWRGDRDRFLREAAVTAALPPGVPYPEVLETGNAPGLAWQVTRAIDAAPLSTVWHQLSTAQQRDAIRQVGQALAALNGHPFPAEVTAPLAAARPVGDTSPGALIGADLNPLPHQRALLLAGPARNLPYVDRALIDDVAAILRDLAHTDPLAIEPGTSCVHGDAHPANILWRDGRLAALLDFEWVRLGPPDLEIQPYLDVPEAADRGRVLGWLSEGHPAAFAVPQLVTRLWLYQLAYTLRQLLIHAPDRPADQLASDHPLPVLRRIVNGPGHLQRFVPADRPRPPAA